MAVANQASHASSAIAHLEGSLNKEKRQAGSHIRQSRSLFEGETMDKEGRTYDQGRLLPHVSSHTMEVK